MKLSYDILSALYRLLNVDALNNIISGKVYIGDAPDKSQLEDVTIKALNNPNNYLQTGIINLNIYAAQLESGRANNSKFMEIATVVKDLVDDKHFNNVHFQISDDKGEFKDRDKDGMYFYNIRLEFQTFKNI